MAYHFGILQQFAGINAMAAYGIYITGKVVPSVRLIFPIALNLWACLFCLAFPILTKFVNRKPILQGGCFISMISTLLMGIGFSILGGS